MIAARLTSAFRKSEFCAKTSHLEFILSKCPPTRFCNMFFKPFFRVIPLPIRSHCPFKRAGRFFKIFLWQMHQSSPDSTLGLVHEARYKRYRLEQTKIQPFSPSIVIDAPFTLLQYGGRSMAFGSRRDPCREPRRRICFESNAPRHNVFALLD